MRLTHTQQHNAGAQGLKLSMAEAQLFYVSTRHFTRHDTGLWLCITKGWHSCRTAGRQRQKRHAAPCGGNADGETPCASEKCAQAQGVTVPEGVTPTTRLFAAAAAGTTLQGKCIRTQMLCKRRGPLPNTTGRPWRFQMEQG